MSKRKNPFNDRKPRTRLTKGVQVGTRFRCADNSGARELLCIGVKGVHGRLNRLPAASIGDVVTCCVKSGKPEMKKEIVLAVIIRQKRAFARRDGTRICFDENAGVIITEKGDLKGSQISGPVPREVADIYPKISSHAPSII